MANAEQLIQQKITEHNTYATWSVLLAVAVAVGGVVFTVTELSDNLRDLQSLAQALGPLPSHVEQLSKAMAEAKIPELLDQAGKPNERLAIQNLVQVLNAEIAACTPGQIPNQLKQFCSDVASARESKALTLSGVNFDHLAGSLDRLKRDTELVTAKANEVRTTELVSTVLRVFLIMLIIFFVALCNNAYRYSRLMSDKYFVLQTVHAYGNKDGKWDAEMSVIASSIKDVAAGTFEGSRLPTEALTESIVRIAEAVGGTAIGRSKPSPEKQKSEKEE